MGWPRSSHLVALVLLSGASAGVAAPGRAADTAAPTEAVRDLHNAVPVPFAAADRRAAGSYEERAPAPGDLPCIHSIQGVGRDRADRFDYLTEEIDGEHVVVSRPARFRRGGEGSTLAHEFVPRHVVPCTRGDAVAGEIGAAREIHRCPRLLNDDADRTIGRRAASAVPAGDP